MKAQIMALLKDLTDGGWNPLRRGGSCDRYNPMEARHNAGGRLVDW